MRALLLAATIATIKRLPRGYVGEFVILLDAG